MNEFERSLAKVLVHEGGYVHDPRDPGGETNQGVTKKVYDDYRRNLGAKTQSIKLMTNGERDSIYRMRYWSLIKGDSLPAGVGYVVFDGAVNSGVKQSGMWLQRALGMTGAAVDGVIGPGTLAALRGINDHDALIARILDRRMTFLKNLKIWKTYRKGWTSRVNDVRAIGQAWASGSVGPEITFIDKANVKARIEDAKTAPTKGIADAATGGGVGSGALAATLQQVQDQLAPFSAGSALIGHVVAGLVIATGVLTIGGVAYRWYATRKKAELADALDKVPV
ncbi:glycoside hydrolase family 108 protein [Ferranicluibacter rubi]|nr:glycoside hydrolase family 108 protein [Ferranicluibacter rubi]